MKNLLTKLLLMIVLIVGSNVGLSAANVIAEKAEKYTVSTAYTVSDLDVTVVKTNMFEDDIFILDREYHKEDVVFTNTSGETVSTFDLSNDKILLEKNFSYQDLEMYAYMEFINKQKTHWRYLQKNYNESNSNKKINKELPNRPLQVFARSSLRC